MPALPNTSLIDIVNMVARSVGHPVAADVTSSLDEAIQRMAYYANVAGGELAYMHNWQALSKTATVSIAADTPGQHEKGFDLPLDFHAMADDTQWNRSTQLPAIGPVNSQDWQWLVVRQAMITTRFMWRIRDRKLWVKSPPITPEDLSFEYLSKHWAVDGTTLEPKDILINNADYHIYPWQLVVMYTRAKWFENEGFDSTGAMADFNKAFQYETGVDKGASALNLVPGRGYPYIDAIKNIPDTGYGAA